MYRPPSSGSLDTALARLERGPGTGASSVNQRVVLLALVALGVLGWSVPLAVADEAAEAKRMFNQRCTACHTFGKGTKVGPDLKGVTERRSRPWLIRFIRSSSATIKSGDPIARELFQKFKQQRMPDWSDLSDLQILALLDWLAANGPEQKEPDERHAEVASTAEIERGRALFHGSARLAAGGLPCAACHGIRDGGAVVGGSLAAALTSAYLRYHDRALTLFFKHPCSPREPERSTGKYLTPHESFALKAYLRQAALTDPGGAVGASGKTGATP
jgi:mono/diheme cytochrome c family protein